MIEQPNDLDGTLFNDAINLIYSFESTYETLSYDAYNALNKETDGLLSEYLRYGQPLTISVESTENLKKGLIVTTIAAIIAAIVYVVRKFLNLPSIQNLKSRLINYFTRVKKTTSADTFVKTKKEQTANENMNLYRENAEIENKEFINLRTAFVKYSGNAEVATYHPEEFIRFYATKPSVYDFIIPEKISSVIPVIFITESCKSDLTNLEYLTSSLLLSYNAKLKLVKSAMDKLYTLSGDVNTIMSMTIPADVTSLSVYKMYLHRTSEMSTDEMAYIIEIADYVKGLFKYEHREISYSYTEITNELSSGLTQAKIAKIVESSKRCIELDKTYMNMIEVEIPKTISYMSEFAMSAARNGNIDIEAQYTKLKNQLTMHVCSMAKTKDLLKSILEGLDVYVDKGQRIDDDIFNFLKLYSEYTDKMVRR